MRVTLFASAIVFLALECAAGPIDFDKIKSWSGDGPNRAALAVTNDAGASDPKVYIWGFRWSNDEHPTGEDMFRAICADNDNLILLTQRTGQYGSTVCGIGVGDADAMLRELYFDFEKALDYEFINFDYYNTNSFFGQSEAPGDRTPVICAGAISEALSSGAHVIQHPLDQPAYGYPAYDYDCWDMTDEGWMHGWWTSAWYAGYWSYWTITGQSAGWMYSGTGYSGRQLSDGCVDGWSFTLFDSPKVGGVGEGTPPTSDEAMYVYCEPTGKSAAAVVTEDLSAVEEYYTLTGRRVSGSSLSPGIYIVRKGKNVEKRLIY